VFVGDAAMGADMMQAAQPLGINTVPFSILVLIYNTMSILVQPWART